MIRHLLITGGKQCGKSTHIGLLSKKIDLTTWLVKENNKPKEIRLKYLENELVIARYNENHILDNNLMCEDNANLDLAATYLDELINSKKSKIYLDEIGFIETRNQNYQNKLLELFEKKEVIAVVRKDDRYPFLTTLLNRNDVRILDLDVSKKPNLIILANGLSKRFGVNKLLYKIEGKTIFEITLEKIDKAQFEKIVVVSRYLEVQEIANNYGFMVVNSENNEQSKSVIAGLEAVGAGSLVMMVSDQIYLKKETINNLVIYGKITNKIVRVKCADVYANPVYFPKEIIKELYDIKGDNGARELLKKYVHLTDYLEVEPKEIEDIDTLEDIK